MGAPATNSGRRRLMIALAAAFVVLLVVAILGGLYITRKQPSRGSARARASSSPSSATVSYPTATPVSTTSGGPLSGGGSLLGPGPGSDTGEGRGNGPGCQIWVDPGWSLENCGIGPVNGSSSAYQAVAYVTEHKPGPIGLQWRVFIMTTTATDAFWHTRLYHSDEAGGGFTNITVKEVDTTGGGRPDLLVGFRHKKGIGSTVDEGNVLDYQVVQRTSASAPLQVTMHRQIANGSVVVSGGQIIDYESGSGGQATKSTITARGGLFYPSGTSQVPASSVPGSILP